LQAAVDFGHGVAIEGFVLDAEGPLPVGFDEVADDSFDGDDSFAQGAGVVAPAALTSLRWMMNRWSRSCLTASRALKERVPAQPVSKAMPQFLYWPSAILERISGADFSGWFS